MRGLDDSSFRDNVYYPKDLLDANNKLGVKSKNSSNERVLLQAEKRTKQRIKKVVKIDTTKKNKMLRIKEEYEKLIELNRDRERSYDKGTKALSIEKTY